MQFIGTQKAAELLDMHPVTLRERAANKEIPGYKIGGKWKFDPKELENYVKEDKNSPEQEMGHKENLCHVKSSRSIRGAKSGTIRSPRQMESEYAEVLGLAIKSKHYN